MVSIQTMKPLPKSSQRGVAEDFQALFDLDWDDYSYESDSEGAGKWLISTVAELMDWGF